MTIKTSAGPQGTRHAGNAKEGLAAPGDLVRAHGDSVGDNQKPQRRDRRRGTGQSGNRAAGQGGEPKPGQGNNRQRGPYAQFMTREKFRQSRQGETLQCGGHG